METTRRLSSGVTMCMPENITLYPIPSKLLAYNNEYCYLFVLIWILFFFSYKGTERILFSNKL